MTKSQLGTFTTHRCYHGADGALVTGETANLDIGKDLIINDLNLQRDLKRHAKTLGWYMQLREEAEYAMKLSKRDWLKAQEKAGDKLRTQEIEESIPKVDRLSETGLKRKINLRRSVQETRDIYMYKAHMYRLLNGFVVALTERGRMLQSMNKRQSDEHHQTT